MSRRRPGRCRKRDLLDRCHETISAPWQGRDEAAAKQLAQCGYMYGQITFLNYPSGPDLFKDFVFRHHAVAPFHEGYKDIKRPTANRNLAAINK